MRLKSVVLPAPFGPMMALIDALGHREAHAAHGLEAVEALADVAHLKHGERRRVQPPEPARAAPARPPGNTKRSTTRMVPRMSGQYSV